MKSTDVLFLSQVSGVRTKLNSIIRFLPEPLHLAMSNQSHSLLIFK